MAHQPLQHRCRRYPTKKFSRLAADERQEMPSLISASSIQALLQRLVRQTRQPFTPRLPKRPDGSYNGSKRLCPNAEDGRPERFHEITDCPPSQPDATPQEELPPRTPAPARHQMPASWTPEISAEMAETAC
jgi:hypothetical protein